MGGAIRISSQARWVVAGWLYDNVLAEIEPEVRVLDQALARKMVEGRTLVGTGWLTMEAWPQVAVRTFYDAAVRLRVRVVAAGPQAFDGPEAYPGFLARLDELIEILRRDPRIGGG